MAITFTRAYENDPNGFEKRVEAQLQAQSIAIAAALALAAKNDRFKEKSLGHQQLRISEVDANHKILPRDDKGKAFAMQHLGDIFAEAKKILEIEYPFDKS